MGVELRVLRAACRMTEGGDREVAGFLAPHLSAINISCDFADGEFPDPESWGAEKSWKPKLY